MCKAVYSCRAQTVCFRYSNGQPLPAYAGDRSYPDLSSFIENQSTLYARGQLVDSNEEKEVVLSGFGRPNPEGKVLEVDEGSLDVLIGNGPVLVEFFAPWCSQSVFTVPVLSLCSLP